MQINRRGFLGLFAAATASVGLGLSPAATPIPEVSGGLYSIRYLEAYDVMEGKLVHRLDFSTMMSLPLPKSIEKGMAYANVNGAKVLDICDFMRDRVKEIPDRDLLAGVLKKFDHSKDVQIFGVSWQKA